MNASQGKPRASLFTLELSECMNQSGWAFPGGELHDRWLAVWVAFEPSIRYTRNNTAMSEAVCSIEFAWSLTQ